MNISSNTIFDLTDYILLNSYTLTSSGLYEGKAGHALCLFEMAHFFQNEELDIIAFNLLEEALLSKTENIDFGFGLSGIGYTLAYLIRHDFIEADFHDFFGKQQEVVFDKIKNEKNKWGLLDLIPFLLEYKQLIVTDNKADALMTDILNDSIYQMENILGQKNWHEEARKENWISYLRLLFRMLFLLQTEGLTQLYDIALLRQLTRNLSALLRAGRINLTDETAFYTTQTTGLEGIAYLDKLTINIVASAVLDLASLTRLSAIQSFSNQFISFEKNPLEIWTDTNIEQMLNSQIGKQQKLCNWQQGIIRYLLYWIYQKSFDKRLFSLLLQ